MDYDRTMLEAMVHDLVESLNAERGEGEPLPFLDEINMCFRPDQMAHEFTFRLSNMQERRRTFYERAWYARDPWNDNRLSHKQALKVIEELYITFGYDAMRPRINPYANANEPIALNLNYNDLNWRNEARQRIHDREMAVQRARRREANRWNFVGNEPWFGDARLDLARDIRLFRREPAVNRNPIRALTPTGAHPEANKRGRKLLLGNLSPEQRHSYETEGYFDVRGGDTGEHYRLFHGTHLNILIPRTMRGMCVIPVGSMVYGDVLLSQKLALELEESTALREAHFFPVDDLVGTWALSAKKEQSAAMRRDGG